MCEIQVKISEYYCNEFLTYAGVPARPSSRNGLYVSPLFWWRISLDLLLDFFKNFMNIIEINMIAQQKAK